MSRRARSELSFLEESKAAVTNAVSNTQIAKLLEEVGFGSEQIAEGQTLLTAAQAAYDKNTEEEAEKSAAYLEFLDKKEALKTAYKVHRKKAKVMFSENHGISHALAITQAMPETYLPWMQSVKMFYKHANAKEEVKTKLATLRVSAEDLTAAKTLAEETEAAYLNYLGEKGEAQAATQTKNEALEAVEKWRTRFYKIAAIAMEDEPQLLESLGKFVRS